ncbi:unnamed protein product [Parnassius apollo]|uniref:(apollo) hypothetical protein n=1 Tax=Parnassius apollo TaxID=110799 RepID=A0A8S3XJW0_PARAO|nr:unnamed protein product [Parnassius apollo]
MAFAGTNISLSQPDITQKLTERIDDLKQKIAAWGKRIHRFTERSRRFNQNRLFQSDQKRLYKSLERPEVCGAGPGPDQANTVAFWRGLWSEPVNHSEGPWTEVVASQCASITPMDPVIITPDDVAEAITLADLNLEQRNVIQHIAGPSTTKQPLSENIQKTITVPNVFEPVAGPSKCIQPLYENVHYKTIPDKTSAIPQVTENINPVAAANPSTKNKKDKDMLIKMKYHLRKINRLQKTIEHLKNEAFLKITLADLNLEQRNVIQHIAGPSTTKQPLSENIQKTITVPNVFEPVAGPSKCIQPLYENVHYKTIPDKTSAIPQVTENINPVAAANPSTKNKKDKDMLIKMKYHLRKINRLQKTIEHLKNEAFLKVLSKNDSVNEILKCKISPSFALFLQGELQNNKKN